MNDTPVYVGIPLAGILGQDCNFGCNNNKGTRKGCPYNSLSCFY
jgi:hypothetical protein